MRVGKRKWKNDTKVRARPRAGRGPAATVTEKAAAGVAAAMKREDAKKKGKKRKKSPLSLTGPAEEMVR